MLLEVKNLSVEFLSDEPGQAPAHAVDSVSFSLNRGEVLGLVGESGCGKSATAMSIPRLLPSPPARITSGEIFFQGENLLSLPIERMREIRGTKIGVIFQDPMTSLSPLHRIGDQLIEVVRLHRNLSRSACRDLALEWLGRVGIPDPEQRAKAFPFELSGGMQQRVMIAMGLILEPELIIADEPTTALDVTIQAQILNLMRKLYRQNSALLLITHDMGVVYQMATKITVMYAGQVVESCEDAARFFAHPQHPYSRALLEALPSAETRGQKLRAIPGQVPYAGAFPPGCRFHDRCPQARPACSSAEQTLHPVNDSLVRCPFTETSK
ncbi:MAG: ABC transporter ATP-binding protein [Kiritimatiellae bacterium]|nr:ABC transporter ATP-binding protein [Kiritimatiellia bacterium]